MIGTVEKHRKETVVTWLDSCRPASLKINGDIRADRRMSRTAAHFRFHWCIEYSVSSLVSVIDAVEKHRKNCRRSGLLQGVMITMCGLIGCTSPNKLTISTLDLFLHGTRGCVVHQSYIALSSSDIPLYLRSVIPKKICFESEGFEQATAQRQLAEARRSV